MKIAAMDDPAAVDMLLQLLRAADGADTHREILEALASSPARMAAGESIAAELELLLAESEDLELRHLVLETAAHIPHPATAALLGESADADGADPLERTAAMAGLVRLHVMDPTLVSQERVDAAVASLAIHAQAAADPEMRVAAIMALAERREDHSSLLRQLRASETDPTTRDLIARVLDE